MKIKDVHISKFRSIENGSFRFDQVTAIVGQNNAGKSAIMRALNSFFNPKEEIHCFIDGTHLYSTRRSVPRITIDFESVPNKATYIPFVINGSPCENYPCTPTKLTTFCRLHTSLHSRS